MLGTRKVAVFGLDGVPHTQLKGFMELGVTPRLAELAHQGSFRPMSTVLPPISSTAWTSFMTGAGPGDHGIFGFTETAADRIALRLPSFDDIRRPVLWQELPSRRFVVVNLPFTYPARPLNGVLVAGFVAPVFERSVYPPWLVQSLQRSGYRIDVDAAKGRHDRGALIQDLFETLAQREVLVDRLMNAEAWDVFICVVTGTDRLNHFFYDATDDPAHPFHSDVCEYFRRVDSFVGRFVASLAPETRLILLSDHGFTRLKTQV